MDKKDYDYNLFGDGIKNQIIDFLLAYHGKPGADVMIVETVLMLCGLVSRTLLFLADNALAKDAKRDVFVDSCMKEINRVVRLMAEQAVPSTYEDFHDKYKKGLN